MYSDLLFVLLFLRQSPLCKAQYYCLKKNKIKKAILVLFTYHYSNKSNAGLIGKVLFPVIVPSHDTADPPAHLHRACVTSFRKHAASCSHLFTQNAEIKDLFLSRMAPVSLSMRSTRRSFYTTAVHRNQTRTQEARKNKLR